MVFRITLVSVHHSARCWTAGVSSVSGKSHAVLMNITVVFEEWTRVESWVKRVKSMDWAHSPVARLCSEWEWCDIPFGHSAVWWSEDIRRYAACRVSEGLEYYKQSWSRSVRLQAPGEAGMGRCRWHHYICRPVLLQVRGDDGLDVGMHESHETLYGNWSWTGASVSPVLTPSWRPPGGAFSAVTVFFSITWAQFWKQGPVFQNTSHS